ncbi:hypothetical protein KFK09_028377 [Dendrobium nobile]|uniref:tRNA(adenine(34)) deaminase n=1 Tax=Dendrobium nobile TaxID=94219 RepID=A0A8T3A2Y3_DENNO|nr:hypothetical protein KFK09_028377 [Dendrobium nobile]
MYGYTAATLDVRAKCSLSFYYLSLPNDQQLYCHRPCCHFSVSSRILAGHLLGLYFPIPSKIPFHAGRRRVRVLYGIRDFSMTELLAESAERFPGLGKPLWKKGRREIHVESIEGEHRMRNEGKTGVCSSWSDGSSLTRDSELNEVRRRSAGGESLTGYGYRNKDTRYDTVNVSDEEVQNVDDPWGERRNSSQRDVVLHSRNDDSTKRNDNFRRFRVKDVGKKVDQRANLSQQVNIRESGSDGRSKMVARISELQLDDVKRTSAAANVRKIQKGESSASATRQNNVMDHQLAGYDQHRRSSEKQSKVADIQSAAYPHKDFNETSTRDRGERAYFEQNLAQVSRDKRIHHDRRALEQDESRRNTQRINEVSLFHGSESSDLGRASRIGDRSAMGMDAITNLVQDSSHGITNFVQDSSHVSINKRSQVNTEMYLSVQNRSEGDEKITMEGNSIQLGGGERKQIHRGMLEHDEARRKTKMLSEVSEVHTDNMEAFSLARDKRGMEFESYFVESSIPATKDKGTQVEMHDGCYDQIEMARFNANNIVNAISSFSPPVTRVDPQEYDTLLASNPVSSLRERKDQANKQTYLLYDARMESERDSNECDLTRSNNRRISNLEEAYNSRIEKEKEFYSTVTSSLVLSREEERKRSSFTGESSQSASMELTSRVSVNGISSSQPPYSELNYDAGWIGYQNIQQDTNDSAGKFGKSSAPHAVDFVGELQKEVTALNESGKTTNISAGIQVGKPGWNEVHATSRIENHNETSSAETSSIVLTQERKERHSSLLLGESSQYKTIQIASTGSLGNVSSSVKSYTEADSHSVRDGIFHFTHDEIESSKRLDKSSASHVDEFVEEIQQEIMPMKESGKELNVSTRFKIEEIGWRESEATAGMQVGELTESRRYGDGGRIKEGRRFSSSGSGMRGPSDEMWGVEVLSSQETSNAEEPEENSSISGAMDLTTPTLETAITRRSPRSLWSYVVDIIRMSWVLRGHSHSSTSKSDKRASSNESLSSDAWFSGPGQEEDGAGDVPQNTKQTGLVNEPGLLKESVKLRFNESKEGDMLTVIEPNSSIPSDLMIGGLQASRTATSSIEAESPPHSISNQDILSSVVIVEQQPASKSDTASPSIVDNVESRVRDKVKVLKPISSFPAAVLRVGFSSGITQASGAELTEAAQVGEGNNSSLENIVQPSASTVNSALPRITDIEEVDRPGSIPKLELDPFSEKLPEVGGTNEAGIKRRKFQRNKQVLSEQFSEWEEAFKRENEQKKLDELFMREAILEAKKGADTWEVPVGAVLVQNGKIIARGCNMVEELRDSTAHAEMICIREASNLLRTWRLAETTLYVTLEPCPMCAGAILQARIDTVVWGAPNRLLGADGSWVRLFPGVDGGSHSMNPPSQMVGPVHPFHPKIIIRRGVLESECGDVMQQFFKLRRKKDKRPESSPPPSYLPLSNRPTKFFSKLHNIFCIMFCL